MKFKEAEKILNKMADGKYHSLKFELSTYADGRNHATVTVYIDGYGHSEPGTNYEIVLANMDERMRQAENPELIEEMLPE